MDDEPIRQVVLPPVTESVATARHFVTDLAVEWELDNLISPCNDLALVVSELMTNAIDHGAGRIDLTVHRHEGSVQVEVTSGVTERRPEPRQPSAATPTGRGLQIVARLSTAWGHRDRGRRRTVWARFSR
jgi:anti-sigma regulatory factor (Ser/Thr protein kinase)